MKAYSIIKTTAVSMLIVGSIGCNKQMEFSNAPLSFSSVENPGAECVATEVNLLAPSEVEQDQLFSMSINRIDASWRLTKGTTVVELVGSEVTTSLNEVGNYSVFVTAINNCGTEEGHEFFVSVTEVEPPVVEPPVIVDPPEVVDPVVSGKADILFVVHNTDSMFSELRDSIPYRFKNFVSQLTGDYRIAVTTGDTRGSRAFEAGGFADILRTPVNGPGIAILPRQSYITPNMEYASRNFLATIMRPEAICIQVTTRRCLNPASGYQQGIEAVNMSINREDTQSFFRNDASLHVVIIADRDQSGGDETAPEKLIAAVQSKWPGKKLKVHTVIRRPQDNGCSANNVEASKAPIYHKLSVLTGGVSSNFCKSMDRKDIEAITNEINK